MHIGTALEEENDTGATGVVDDGTTDEEVHTLVEVVHGVEVVDTGATGVELTGHWGCPSTYSVHTAGGEEVVTGATGVDELGAGQ